MAKEIKNQHNDDDSPDGLFWQADAFLTYPHPSTWYISIVTVALALIGIALLLRKELQVSVWLLIAVIVAGALVMIVRSVIRPPRVKYGLSVDGVVIDQKTTPFSEFRSFAVLNLHDHNVLRLWSKEKWSLPLSIIVESTELNDIKQVLLEVLPEEDHDGSISDFISRIVRF